MESKHAKQRIIEDIKNSDERIQVTGYIKNIGEDYFTLNDKSDEIKVNIKNFDFKSKEKDLINVIGDLTISVEGEKTINADIIQEMNKLMNKVDIYIAPSFGGENLLLTNLTGHPCVVMPNGFNEKGSPASISFIGGLFDEGKLLAFANSYQQSTDFHLKHPTLFIENDE